MVSFPLFLMSPLNTLVQ